MRAFLVLLGITLLSGTALSLHSLSDLIYFAPLYILSLYHLYRVNYSKGFFLIFLAEPDKKDSVKVRVGPSELEAKDDAERNEDKFLELFDWKKALTRRALSWFIFIAAIYIIYFQFKVDITLESILPILTCMCLMRVIAVGHLLVPLSLNLYGALRNVSGFTVPGNFSLLIYGVLFIVCLALVYPSEEKLAGKLRDWRKGKWLEILSVMAILFITFSAAFFLLKDFRRESDEPEVSKNDIQKEIAKVEKLQSSLRNLMGIGLMQDKNLLDKSSELSESLRELAAEGKPSRSKLNELLKRGDDLESEFGNSLVSSPAPDLSPELLDYMKNDIKSRMSFKIDEATELGLQNFLNKAENFKGSGGDELVAEYRRLKHGRNGFYNEETEFDHRSGNADSRSRLEQIKRSEDRKREITAQLAKNIEDIKREPDEGLLSVNKALKDELEQIDSLAEGEREALEQALKESQELDEVLRSRTEDPQLREKLMNLAKENRSLSNEVASHMNAAKKSEIAEKILEHQRKMEIAGREVKDEILRRQDGAFNHSPRSPESEKLLKEIKSSGAASLTADEHIFMRREIMRSKEMRDLLERKAKNPELKKEVQKLESENKGLSRDLRHEMSASEKSQIAERILQHQKNVESVGKKIKEATAVQEKPEETEDHGKVFQKVLKFIAIGILGFIISWFLSRFMKKGVKKVRGIPQEIKDDLTAELKAITKKKLSPREEVIETYNVFHDGLKTLIFTNETPPSCIVYEGIKTAEPELDGPTFTVTETFAKTFYGGRDVSVQDLKSFRKDIRKVFGFFDISY